MFRVVSVCVWMCVSHWVKSVWYVVFDSSYFTRPTIIICLHFGCRENDVYLVIHIYIYISLNGLPCAIIWLHTCCYRICLYAYMVCIVCDKYGHIFNQVLLAKYGLRVLLRQNEYIYIYIYVCEVSECEWVSVFVCHTQSDDECYHTLTSGSKHQWATNVILSWRHYMSMAEIFAQAHCGRYIHCAYICIYLCYLMVTEQWCCVVQSTNIK